MLFSQASASSLHIFIEMLSRPPRVRQNGGGDLMAVVVEAGDEDTAPAADSAAADDQPANDEEPPFDGEPEKKTFASQALVALDNQLRKAIINSLIC
jgi:hypothetical protein